MIVVLDASAAIRTVLGAAPQPAFTEALSDAEVVLAPELFIPETANAIWKYVRASQLHPDQAERKRGQCVGLVTRFEPHGALAAEALDLARATGRSVYDALYLVLARRNVAVLLTTDKQLQETAGQLGIRLPN